MTITYAKRTNRISGLPTATAQFFATQQGSGIVCIKPVNPSRLTGCSNKAFKGVFCALLMKHAFLYIPIRIPINKVNPVI